MDMELQANGQMLPYLGDNVKGTESRYTHTHTHTHTHTQSPEGGTGEVAGCSHISSRDLKVFIDPSNGISIDVQKVSALRHYNIRTICHPAQCEQNTS